MRIVMIEDEARIASFVKSGLESEGFLVEHADDGAAGLELVLDTDPDLVILDLILPRMGGEEVLGRLRGALGIRSVRPVAPAIVGLHALERHAATGEADGHHAGLTGGEAVAARRQSGGQRLRRPAGAGMGGGGDHRAAVLPTSTPPEPSVPRVAQPSRKMPARGNSRSRRRSIRRSMGRLAERRLRRS
jgi:CheY-like chemotaxis protein